jgi:hypothetical protein
MPRRPSSSSTPEGHLVVRPDDRPDRFDRKVAIHQKRVDCGGATGALEVTLDHKFGHHREPESFQRADVALKALFGLGILWGTAHKRHPRCAVCADEVLDGRPHPSVVVDADARHASEWDPNAAHRKGLKAFAILFESLDADACLPIEPDNRTTPSGDEERRAGLGASSARGHEARCRSPSPGGARPFDLAPSSRFLDPGKDRFTKGGV